MQLSTRSLCHVAALLLVASMSAGMLATAGTAQAGEEGEIEGQAVELLSVQSGTSGSFDGERLTLEGVGSTLVFTDRPARLDGHVRTADFIAGWGEGPNSFEEDPPNAVLSILGKGQPQDVAVELAEPRVDGNTVSYRVVAKDGEIPAKFSDVSLFIDGHAGAWIGGALLGGALTRANMNAEEARRQSAGYSYRAAPAAPCVCKCD